jgi:pimeloyl-ACP methyl ester carboxylesterase
LRHFRDRLFWETEKIAVSNYNVQDLSIPIALSLQTYVFCAPIPRNTLHSNMKLVHRIVGEGQALVILHGLFGSGDNWLTVSKLLSEKHQLILIDQRNHGRSPHSQDWNYDCMADDLYELIQDLNLQNPILMGHSMGGKTVMQFAIRYPQVASKIIVVDISPKPYPLHHQTILEGLLNVQLANITSRQEAEAQMTPFIEQSDVRQFLLKNLYRLDSGQFAWRINLPLIVEKIAEVGVGQSSATPIITPTLFVRGQLSNYIKDSDWPAMQQLFPNSELVTVADAGHWVQAEQPVNFVAAVKPFIES